MERLLIVAGLILALSSENLIAQFAGVTLIGLSILFIEKGFIKWN